MVEPGALVKIFADFEDVLMDFKNYEALSRTSGVDVKGLMHCLGLVEKLLGLAPTAEINSQALRKALLEMLRMNPKLNRTKFNWGDLGFSQTREAGCCSQPLSEIGQG